jgi:hypothetical protein
MSPRLDAIKKICESQVAYSESAHKTFLDYFSKEIWIESMNSLFQDLTKKKLN